METASTILATLHFDREAELAAIPNADHFTMSQQFDIDTMFLMNFVERLIGTDQKHGTR
jgi:hypothetical protein